MSRSAIEVKPDSQGRVAVTPEVLQKFGIDRKITVVGMGSYMELWDPGALEKLDTDAVDSGFMDEFYR
jgi:DNA-binding transcriptional regulator/RsmH inhibitor MraZ